MPPRATTLVDPRFPTELRRLREARGLSLRQLAAAVNHGKSLIHQLEAGQTKPTVDVTVRLDDALHANGVLAALVVEAPQGGDRLAYVRAHQGRADRATAEALAGLLAGYRRLEDAIGSGPIMRPVRDHLGTVTSLLRDAPDDVRPRMVDLAGQWAQFAGWLSIARGEERAATVWNARALQWASEAGNADLVATVVSFQGYQAECRRDLPTMIRLSRESRRDHTVTAALRAYCAGQEARGLAMAGAESTAVLGCLSEASDLSAQAAEEPLSPWGYWYTPSFFAIQQGSVLRHLGATDSRANDRALGLLMAGVAGVNEEANGAEWHGHNLIHLAVAQAQAGDTAAARETLAMADAIAIATASQDLAHKVIEAVHLLGLSATP
ncbi:helix-turn-helix transcriptional regulator [Micromonospora sp. ALFpr18c]|uniref:helix-turn-helix domain-containing protein n=1 Tax=unclassified Micromonospora TaxID=2617518 RepID=UPI00124BC3D3|nr:helix-turn-helix domain-containing protein [Micromonospora sp. ALFpr18c]KAB1930750.1 helix-turn-helix transcriptional regulator [Micromonospora sp. ALFpr18c]